MRFTAFLFFFLWTGLIYEVGAQCVTTSSQVIPDDGILSVDFVVSGLLDNDLASPTQGICGIEIDFMHEYLGDLTVTLRSPSGTLITLIGPVTTAITPTNLTRWNIEFVPCLTGAMPDPGFTPVWSNLQSWNALTVYSGTYHPHIGCLEDFNSGPANGVWTITVEDHDILQTGSLANVTLIFCNPAGLQCMECSPNAGILSPPSIVACVGDNIESSALSVDFSGSPPSPVDYSYSYVMTSGNSIIADGSAITESPAPGLYSICGLSYPTSDTVAINSLLTAGDYNQLSQSIDDGTICAQLTSQCVNVNVLAIPDTTVMDFFLCRNESVVFKGQLYTTAGTYYVVEDGIGSCDSVFRLNISINDLTAIIASPDSISCGGPGVLLDGSLSQGGTGTLTFNWTTVSGTLSGNINNPQVTALTPGLYTLTVNDGTCDVALDVVVHEDLSYPRIFVEGGAITCIDTSITIKPIVFPSNVTYLWTGPGGFVSALKDIVVSAPGQYILRVTSPDGCEVIGYADVLANTSLPNPTIILASKDCLNNSAIIGSVDPNGLFNWSGPGEPFPPNLGIIISQPGTYSLTVTDYRNGCTATGTYNFDADYTIPTINISGMDSIRCNQSVSLTLNSSAMIGQPNWSGPNSFKTTGFNVTLTQPGIYTVDIISPNGCTNVDTIELFASSNYPDFTVTNDTISCTDNIATIGISVMGADIYNWIDLQPPEAGNSIVQVSDPGPYFVTALDTNSGCLIETHAFVASDFALPRYSFQSENLTCNQTMATLTFLPVAGQIYTDVHWQLPDMSVIANPIINVGTPGQYLLSVTGLNGCVETSLITVGYDTLPPVFFVEADSLGCNNLATIHSILVDSLQSISWSGPGGFTSSEFNPMVPDTGLYFATGIGLNGCSKEIAVYVYKNFTAPLSFVAGDSLTCSAPVVTLSVNSPDRLIAYEWKDDAGWIIGVDSAVQVSNPGLYTVQIEGENHCFTLDSIFLDPPVFPNINIIADTLTCEIVSQFIMAESDILNSAFIWMDVSGDTIGLTDQLQVNDPGPFTVAVTAPNGCEIRDTILIPVNTSTPIAIINMVGDVRCQERDFMLDGSSSTPSSINYLWSTIGGMILSPADLPLIDTRDTGIYILNIINPANGCTDVDTISVDEHPSAILRIFLEIQQPACSGNANGEIKVNGLKGGVEPFLFQLDNFPPQTLRAFSGLGGGTYRLRVIDAEGCVYDSTITIVPTAPFIVEAGLAMEIHIGESATLTGMTDINPLNIVSQDWDSLGVVLCLNCPELIVTPFTTTTYRFQVTSSTGCVLNDEVVVYVIEKGKFFIPNVFSPNGDNINEEVRFYPSPGIVKVLKWIIFDRWGDAVFGRTDFDPSDQTIFWDGTTQGSVKLNPGVFPYIVELELANGGREIHHGSITLIR